MGGGAGARKGGSMNRAERRAAARASRRPVRRAGSKRSPVTAAVEQRRMRRMVDVMAPLANADVTVKESCLDPLTLRVTVL